MDKVSIIIAFCSLLVSIVVLVKTIEWQKRSVEKNIFTQVTVEQWKQDWLNYWNKPSGAQPETLTERLIKARVLKRN